MVRTVAKIESGLDNSMRIQASRIIRTYASPRDNVTGATLATAMKTELKHRNRPLEYWYEVYSNRYNGLRIK